jgi:hypothetical protein
MNPIYVAVRKVTAPIRYATYALGALRDRLPCSGDEMMGNFQAVRMLQDKK